MKGNNSERQFITKTSGMDNKVEKQPKTGDFEIGFTEDGEGYLLLPVFRDGTVKEFSIPANEVKEYQEERNCPNPIPSPPDGIEREPEIEPPEEFKGEYAGHAVNTGGGIYCRIWNMEIEDSNKQLEVIYQLPTSDGISVNIANDKGEFMGEFHTEVIGEETSDQVLQHQTKELIERISNEEFKGELDEVAK